MKSSKITPTDYTRKAFTTGFNGHFSLSELLRKSAKKPLIISGILEGNLIDEKLSVKSPSDLVMKLSSLNPNTTEQQVVYRAGS